MIHSAIKGDIPALEELVREFHGASKWAATPYDRLSVERLLYAAIESDDATLLVNEKMTGFALFNISPLPFATGILVAGEIGFLGGGSGMALLRTVKEWATERGAHSIITNSHPGMKNPDKLYKRMGFEPFEGSYRMVL